MTKKTETIKQQAATVIARYGKTTGASKGSKPAPPPKVKPTGSLKNPGIKAIWKF